MDCPVCNSSRKKELDYGGYRYQGKNLPLVKCAICGLKYIEHSLSDTDVEAFYDEPEYFDSEYAGGVRKDYESNEIAQREKALVILRAIAQKARQHYGAELLEIGCAGGFFLEEAKRCFYKVKGLELSHTMTDFAKSRGLDVVNGSIGGLPRDWDPFDVVYMGDVLEHVREPYGFLRDVSAAMREGGLLVLELPATYNLTISGIILGIKNLLKGRIGYRYFLPAHHRASFVEKAPYHLLMFGKKSIKLLLSESGYELVTLRFHEGLPKDKHAGGLYGFAKRLGHFFNFIRQPYLGDRILVIARKR